MKLPANQVKRFLANPDATRPAMLLHGIDAARVATARGILVAALTGPDAAQDLQLDRIAASDLRREPALLIDALKARGFFPGPRAVIVEDATDTAARIVADSLADWAEGDATLIVTAGTLRPASPLRKLFETSARAICIPIYADPPTREEIEAEAGRAGLARIDPEAMQALLALGRELEPGDLSQTLTKLALYKLGDPDPASVADIEAIAPLTIEAELDDAIRGVAEGRASEVARQLQRLAAQGTSPVALCSGVARHFRLVHAAACDAGGPEHWAESARVFGPRRDQIIRQARHWGMDRLESALAITLDTDLALRSPRPLPAHALVERACIRIAMLCPR